MAITTIDGLVAGFKPPRFLQKIGTTKPAFVATSMRGYTTWYASGAPGASTATTIGIDGEAVTPSSTGVIPHFARANPVSGNAYLTRFGIWSSLAGQFLLVDRLWQNSGLSATLTSAQSITSATLPARDANGSTNGDQVFAALEWSGAGGATSATSVTLSYTNQDGTSGRTATIATPLASPPVGTWEIFQLQAGDTGIRSVQSLTNQATRTSGTFHLVLYRVLAILDVNTNTAASIDFVSSAMPRVYDGTTLQVIEVPTATTAALIFGNYVEAQG